MNIRKRLHSLEGQRCRVYTRMYADTSGLCVDCRQLLDTALAAL